MVASALVVLIPAANGIAATLIGVEPSVSRHWGIAFLLPFLLLLPATAAMGATLPAMERLVFRMRRGGHAVDGLYAANTFGAVAGILLSTTWLAPTWGFTATLLVLAAINATCALGTLVVTGRRPEMPADVETGPAAAGEGNEVRRLSLILFATGFLGIGYEVLVIRMLSQILENTIYSFAAVLAVYLLGTALGGMLYQLFRRERDFQAKLAWPLISLSASCLGYRPAPARQTRLRHPPRPGISQPARRDHRELGVATLVLFVPTLLMGATFSHLGQRIRDVRDRLGYAVAANTLGASVAPLAFGVGLLPAVGSKAALLAVSAGYLLLVPTGGRRRWGAVAALSATAGVVLMALMDFRFVEVPSGGAIIAHEEGVMAAVSVVSDHRQHRFLKVNDEFTMGSTASSYSDRRQAHVPLLLHPQPRRAVFLGLGTDSTLSGGSCTRDCRAQNGVKVEKGKTIKVIAMT